MEHIERAAEKRRLRIYATDPMSGRRAPFRIAIDIDNEPDLKRGPRGEIIEIWDYDVDNDQYYRAVNLNDPALLMEAGLAPSESDPRFHQQMVYAVTMKVIESARRALGRPVTFYGGRSKPRLRLLPHAFYGANAFFDSKLNAILFGYFRAHPSSPGPNLPSQTVFTCLSHDIIAHETTHALLDGVHPRFNEPVNEDVLAFHEAFADIVALFQHFSYPGVLRDQIARTRGDLARESVLGQLAQQFARASGRGDALRNYLGGKNAKGEWEAARPNPTVLEQTSEPHDRGAILVAAVFGAFTKVYRKRTSDLFRIATEGTGVLREGDIHPDLVNRLANEAQLCADRALQMCIRAIDYCPPVGITFGAYLRALVTADHDMYPVDQENWRLAFIESFREWGISPRGARSMAEDSLLWPTEEQVVDERLRVSKGADKARKASRNLMEQIFTKATPNAKSKDYQQKAQRAATLSSSGATGDVLKPTGLQMPRLDLWLEGEKQSLMFHGWLMDEGWRWMTNTVGLVVDPGNLQTISMSKTFPNKAAIEIHSIRTAMKRGALGWPEPHIVAVITQWRAGWYDTGKQKEMDKKKGAYADSSRDFRYRAGATLLIDPEGMRIRRVIRTPGTVADEDELDRMRRYLLDGLSPPNAFAPVAARFSSTAEPFALLHSHGG
jgi:hypothetical protein